MKIADAYEKDNIFRHLGKRSQFQLCGIENGQIISSEVVDTNGSGHDVLVDCRVERPIYAS